MSEAILKIWDPEVLGAPKSFAKMMEIAGKHDEDDGVPTALLLQFAQAVQDHARQHPDEFPNYVNFVERMQRVDMAVVSLEVPYRDNYEDVIVLLAETASRMGLPVLLEDWLMAWLPGGQVLPKTKAAEWEAFKEMLNTEDPEQPKTLAKFKKVVEPTLVPILSREGFQLNEEKSKPDHEFWVYSLSTSGICEKIELWLSYINNPRDFYVKIRIVVYCSAVMDIYARFELSDVSAFTFYAESSPWLVPFDWYKGLGLKQKIALQKQQIEEGMLGIVHKLGDIQGLDWVMNSPESVLGKDLRASFYIPHCAIVARLAGNPRFEELIVELESNKRRAGANSDAMYGTEFKRLIDYLRDEVKPLV